MRPPRVQLRLSAPPLARSLLAALFTLALPVILTPLPLPETIPKMFLVCKTSNFAVCTAWPIHNMDSYILQNYPRGQVNRFCGFSNLKKISPHRNVLKVQLQEEYGSGSILCNMDKLIFKKILTVHNMYIHNKTLDRKPRAAGYGSRGRYRGQTQSQYLSIDRGNNKDEGKAEAHSDADSSRASVSGTSGMGQAQSQSMYDPSCDECLGKTDINADNFKPKHFEDSTTSFDSNRLRPGINSAIGPENNWLPGTKGGYQNQGSTPGATDTTGSRVIPDSRTDVIKSQHGNYGRTVPNQANTPGEQTGIVNPNAISNPNIDANVKPTFSSQRGASPVNTSVYPSQAGRDGSTNINPSGHVDSYSKQGGKFGPKYNQGEGNSPYLGGDANRNLVPNAGGNQNGYPIQGGSNYPNQEILQTHESQIPLQSHGKNQEGSISYPKGNLYPNQGVTSGSNGFPGSGSYNQGPRIGTYPNLGINVGVPNQDNNVGFLYDRVTPGAIENPIVPTQGNWPITSGSYVGPNGLTYYCCVVSPNQQPTQTQLNAGQSPNRQNDPGKHLPNGWQFLPGSVSSGTLVTGHSGTNNPAPVQHGSETDYNQMPGQYPGELQGSGQSPGGQYTPGQSPSGQHGPAATLGVQYGSGSSPTRLDGPGQSPGGQYRPVQSSPGAQYGSGPSAAGSYGQRDSPSGKYGPGSSTSGTYTPGQSPDGKYVPSQPSGGLYGPGQSPGGTYEPGKFTGAQHRPGQFTDGQSSGGQYEPGQLNGGQYGPQHSGRPIESTVRQYGTEQSPSGSFGPVDSSGVPGQLPGGSYKTGKSPTETYVPGQTLGGTYMPDKSRSGIYGPGQVQSVQYGSGPSPAGTYGPVSSSGAQYAPGQLHVDQYGPGKSSGGQNIPGQSPGVLQYPSGQSPGGQYIPESSPGVQYPPDKSGGGQYIPGQSPGVQYPPGQSPGGQYIPGSSPGVQYPPDKSSGGQYIPGQSPGVQYPPDKSTGGQYIPGQSPGVQYPPGQSTGGQYIPGQSPGVQYQPDKSTGGQHIPGQSPGVQYPSGQSPGGQYIPGSSPGVQFSSGQSPGGQNIPGSSPVVQYLPDKSTGGQYIPGQSPGVQYPPGQSSGGQYRPGQSPGVQYPPGQSPGGQYKPEQSPGVQYPPAQSPGGQYIPGQSPGVQYPPGQSPGGQYIPGQSPGVQYPPGQSPGGQYKPGQSPEVQYPPGQSPGGQYIPGQSPGVQYPSGQSTGGQYIPGQSPGVQYPPGQSPGGQYISGQSPGVQYPSGQSTGGQYIPGQSPGVQYPPGQSPGGQYIPGQLPGLQNAPGLSPGGQYIPGRSSGEQNVHSAGGANDHEQSPGGQYGPGQSFGGQYKPGQSPDERYGLGQYPGRQHGPTGEPGTQYFSGVGSPVFQPTNTGHEHWSTQTIDRNGVPQNVRDPNSIAATLNDYDSNAEATVAQNTNSTIASASSRGGNEKGRAQTNVQGTYSGSGSFSAQAEISDENKAAQSQVEGSKKGAKSSAQGRGKNNLSQASVQLGSETGSLQTAAETKGSLHSSNSKVQGSVKGGMSDAQAKGPGSTSSQAQIGFTPYKQGDKAHDQMKSPFVGQGTASAQSSDRSGQSQSSLGGTFKYGISYSGAAQSGASLDKDAVFPNRLPYNNLDVYDESNKNINVDTEGPLDTEDATENSPTLDNKTESYLNDSASQQPGHTHSDHHKFDNDIQTPNRSVAVGTRRSFQPKFDTNSGEYGYTTGKDDAAADDYYPDGGFGPDNPEAEPNEYANYDEYTKDVDRTHESLQTENKGIEIKQNSGGNTQHIVLGTLGKQDAEITQQNSDNPDESRIYQPGEKVPGTGGYTIPIGFTGSVKSVASKDKTYVVGHKDSPAQAQTVALSPGSGKVRYAYPSAYGRNVKPKDLRSLYHATPDDSNRYVSVSKSVTKDLDSEDNIRKQYSHTYYTKSSSCGYFTFTCTMVSGADGRKKVCKPKIPTNPDGSPMKC